MKTLVLVCLAVLSSLAVTVHAQDPWPFYDTWPFDATEAVKRQTETAEAMKQPVTLKIPLGQKEGGPSLDWQLIPAARYTEGSPTTESGHEGDETLHPEMIRAPYYMMQTQLTVEQYRALMHEDPPTTAQDADPKLPAGVTYRDTMDKVLPAVAKVVPAGWRVILPDRARLEFAMRAGVATMTPGGDTPESAGDYAWTRENSGGKVHPVAQKKPNAWGLYDCIGNRWHWYWRGLKGNYSDSATDDHVVYGGSCNTEVGGNGARLANIMISHSPEGVRLALIRLDTPLPADQPDSAAKATSQTLTTGNK